MKAVKEQLREMLTENTGSHFLDSGGAYGRNWERNQAKDFDSEPRVSYDVYDGQISYEVSVYHYLAEVLEVDEVSEEMSRVIRTNDLHWTGEVADFIKGNEFEWDITIKGDSVNTYNYDSNLSQVLQFLVIRVNDEPYVILQIHGGCDVRGGYTESRCFKLIGWLSGLVDVSGTINGVDVDNSYDGSTLRDDNDSENFELFEANNEIELDFWAMDEEGMYIC